jgi:drug/metabolite transporter (DMT)-like permease
MLTRRPSYALGRWLLFGMLALVWGSSYFWIKVGVDEGLKPFTLVSLRLGISVVALLVLLAATRSRLPRDRGTLARLAVLGVINVALPFGLITWAEQYVGSALASILNALVPLFAMVFAAIALHDEPFTLNRLGGLLIGFVGAVLLLGRHLVAAPGSDPGLELLGDVALVLSSASYAGGLVFTRRFVTGRTFVDDPLTGRRTLRPAEIALPQNSVGFVIVATIALLTERTPGGGIALPVSGLAWLSVAWLGVLGSAVAYLLFFRLVQSWGATRTSTVTYVMPIIGIALGAIILHETIDLQVGAGAALVLGGIALVNARIGARRIFGRSAPLTAFELAPGEAAPFEVTPD